MAAIRAVGERTRSLEAQVAAAPRPEEGGDRKRPCGEVSSSTTASTAAAGSADLLVIWILGLPRELLATQLKKFAAQLLGDVSVDMARHSVVRAFNLENRFSVNFDSVFMAHKFLSHYRENDIVFEGTKLRARPDRSADVRQRNRILGGLWAELSARPALDSKSIGQNGPKGKVFVSDMESEQVWILFTLTTHGHADVHIESNSESCSAVGLGGEEARDIVDKVTTKVTAAAAASNAPAETR